MHMSDALIAPAVAGSMYLFSGAATAYSLKKIKLENEIKKIPVMGVMGAFVFAVQMLNFAIPGTGASGHLCGAVLLTALLGPYAGFLTLLCVLTLQCLLFADGGILALGCNIWNMAFYGCFAGSFFLQKPLIKTGTVKRRIMAASMLGCIVSLQLGAFSVTLETLFSGITELPFGVFLGFMQPIHLAIGLVEGIVTSLVLVFLYEARPSLLQGVSIPEKNTAGKTREEPATDAAVPKRLLVVFFLGALLAGGGLSLFASTKPDGLEWSVERTAEEFPRAESRIHGYTKALQEKTALLPDYSRNDGEIAVPTGIAGVAGSLLLTAASLLISRLLGLWRKRKGREIHGTIGKGCT